MDSQTDRETQMLLREYDTLVDLLKHQHVRLLDMYKTFLTSNTILVGICAVIFQLKPSGFSIYMLFFGLVGVMFSIVWMCISERINLDAELRWYQLRYTERRMGRPNGIFNSGYVFFFNKEEYKSPDGKETLPFPTSFKHYLVKPRVTRTSIFLPGGFAILYGLFIFTSFF